jgi:uncharacterized protein
MENPILTEETVPKAMPAHPVALTARQRLKLFRGKARRLYLALFRPGYLRAKLARRRGECRRCGACCQLGYRCGALRTQEAITACRFHKYRPLNCRVFPIDERDLADRDLIAPGQPCGFRFEESVGRTSGAAAEPSPSRRDGLRDKE